MQAEPAKVALDLKQRGFEIYSMELSASGEQLCIAGTQTDDMGAGGGRLLLVDRMHNAVLWQKNFAAPDGNAAVYPVQCQISAGQVYLLAHAVTSNSPPNARTLTYVFRFDGKDGKPAHQQLRLAARNAYGYALDSSADSVKVSGYLDSTYITGLFAPAKLAKNDDTDDIAASRLRLNGAYVWSVHPTFGTRSGGHASVATDGALYALRYADRTTSLLAVAADGKPLPPRSYASDYCATSAIAGFGKGVLAVREVCSGKGHALLSIDPDSGKESAVNWVPDEPLYVASGGQRQ